MGFHDNHCLSHLQQICLGLARESVLGLGTVRLEINESSLRIKHGWIFHGMTMIQNSSPGQHKSGSGVVELASGPQANIEYVEGAESPCCQVTTQKHHIY